MRPECTDIDLEMTAVLIEVADKLTSTLDLEQVLSSVAGLVSRFTGRSRISVSLIDSDTREVEIVYVLGEPSLPSGTRVPLSMLPSVAIQALEAGRPMVVDVAAVEMPPSIRAFYEQNAILYFLAVPLIMSGRLIGLLGIDEPGVRHEFSEKQLRLVEGIAPQAAAAIENARLYEAEAAARRDAGRELETTRLLLRAAEALADRTDVTQVLNRLVEVLLASVSHSRAGVYLWDDRRRELTQMAAQGRDAFPAGTRFPFGIVAETTRRILTEHKTGIVDFDTLSPEERGTGMARANSHLLLVVPFLSHDGRLMGVIGVDDPGERRGFSDREIQLIEGIASQAAVAIENATLFEVERERARLSDAMNSIDRSLRETLEPDEILRRAVVEAGEALKCDSAVLELRQDGEWVIRHAYRLPQEFIGRTFRDEDMPLAALAAREEGPIAIDDASVDPRLTPEIRRVYPARSILVVPLTVRDEMVGLLFFNYHEQPHVFSRLEKDFASRLSASLGLAVSNARMYEAERDVADTLQTALLALPERIPGVEIAHVYRSASMTARVGGDFYDIFELEHDRVGITVGDISGKGLDAAVLTSLAKNTIRAQATEPDNTPSDAMETANKVLLNATAVEVFATIFFGILDLSTGDFVYCNAGHTSGVCLCSMGGVRRLSANSPLVGAFPDVRYSDTSIRMYESDMLFLYTDGLAEARHDGKMFGEDRIASCLAGMYRGDVADVVRTVVEDVVLFTEGRMFDDIAVLAMKMTAHPKTQVLARESELGAAVPSNR